MTEPTKAIAEIVGRTLHFFATDREDFSFTVKDRTSTEAVILIDCAPADIGFILGGKGKNTKAVLDLAQSVLPPGTFLSVDFARPMPTGERGRRTLTARSRMDAAEVLALHRVVSGWHRLLGFPETRIRHEQTESAEVFVCEARELASQSMKSLRLFVGWACTIRGRHGFIEWERW